MSGSHLTDRRAVSTARRLDQDFPGRPNPSEATGDPLMAAWLGRQHPQYAGPRLETGTVVDVVPGAHAYLVSAGQRSLLWCSPGGTAAAFGAFGGRPLTTIPVGTPVIFVRHPETPYAGTVVAAEPHWSAHVGNQPADGVWPFVRSGHGAESAHRYPAEASAAWAAATQFPLIGVDGVDFSAGRPLDSTAVGEWGVIAETGVGVFADPFQAYLRADEATGVFAFYPDQMLRVAGHNFQFRTSRVDEEHLEDEGELYGYRTECHYPWEGYGLWRWNQVTPGWADSVAADVAEHGLAPGQGTEFRSPQKTLQGDGYAPREPEETGQLPAARGHVWDGYLGQGGHRAVAAPAQLDRPGMIPGGAPANNVRTATPTHADTVEGAPAGRVRFNGSTGPLPQPYAVRANRRGGPDQPGLAEEHRTLTGGLHWRSARRIVFAKYPSIPLPRPARRPEDPAGDRPAGSYAPSGLTVGSATPAHKVAGDVGQSAEGPAHRAAMLGDALAYLFNWEGLHPFAYHAADWDVAQEGDAGSGLVNQKAPDFSLLEVDQYLAAPAPTFLDVDHRYGLVPVYETQSTVALLDDGTVVVTDGWGSSIEMGGGSITLKCAGDVNLMPGRNLTAWAGHDVVLRAHDTVDVTAANGDLRTKADKNHHSLAGNSGCGGFLFESKAECPAYDFAGKLGEQVVSSGFTVLVPASEFLVFARDVTMVLADPEDEADPGGRMYLDGGALGEIHTRSKMWVSQILGPGSIVHLFDADRGNEFAPDYTFLGTDVLTPGSVYAAQCVTAGQWLYAGVHVATAQGGAAGVRANTYGSLNTGLTARRTYLSATYRAAFENQTIYPAGADAAEFSMRTKAQYRTEGYEFWRARWEAIARGDGQTMAVWVEPEVVGLRSEEVTRPHPGERWTEADAYRYHSHAFTDPGAEWVALDRDADRAAYEAGVLTPAPDGPLDEYFPVSVPAG